MAWFLSVFYWLVATGLLIRALRTKRGEWWIPAFWILLVISDILVAVSGLTVYAFYSPTGETRDQFWWNVCLPWAAPQVVAIASWIFFGAPPPEERHETASQ